MSIAFGGPASTEALRVGLSVPDLNNVGGATVTCWTEVDEFPNPLTGHRACAFIELSIGPPPGESSQSRFAFEAQNNEPVGTSQRYAIVARALDSDAGAEVGSAHGTFTLGRAFVAATFNYQTRNIKFYKNGVLIFDGFGDPSDVTAGNTSATNSKVVGIASSDDGLTEYLDGRLEDLRVYSRELTPDEIQTIYECQGIDGDVQSLQQRYEMQDNSPSVNVNDSSASDSGPQQINACVPPFNGTPAYRESIGPTYRRRMP